MTPRNAAIRWLFPTALAALALAPAGCTGARSIDTSYARSFPALSQARVLEIQVRREPATIALTNTTASPIPACTIWVNQRYSRPFDGLGVGESATLPLGSFVDEFGERFRPGGFWATRASERVVLVQFEVAGEGEPATLLGTVVVNGEEDPDLRRRRANPYAPSR